MCVGATWMLPSRGPMPGGDVICGEAQARLESRDSRLGAGSDLAELALLLGLGSSHVTRDSDRRRARAGRAGRSSFALYTWMKTGSAQVT